MKATLFLSSIFFLLGLKISSLIDLRGKANAVDQIISSQIFKSNPIKALPLFSNSEDETDVKETSNQGEIQKKENDTQSIPETAE